MSSRYIDGKVTFIFNSNLHHIWINLIEFPDKIIICQNRIVVVFNVRCKLSHHSCHVLNLHHVKYQIRSAWRCVSSVVHVTRNRIIFSSNYRKRKKTIFLVTRVGELGVFFFFRVFAWKNKNKNSSDYRV